MSAPKRNVTPRIWRPTVAASLAYVALFTLFVLWMMSTLEGRAFSDFVLRPRVFELTLFHLLSIANGICITVLLLDVGAARRSKSAQRTVQFWGVLMAILMMVGVQAATFSMLNAAEALASP